MRRRWLLTLLVPSIAGAQMLDMPPGTRVKLPTPGAVSGSIVGVVAAQSRDSITILTSNPAMQYRVPLSSISSLSISRGRSSWQGAKKGFLWGVAIGVPLSAWVAFDSTVTANGNNGASVNRGEYFATSSVSFALCGAIIGAIVRAEAWSDYEMPARISVSSSGARIGASFRF